ncbi:MAG: COR domain-containing protein [Cyanobacteria bacterium J06598_1]
MTTLCYPQRWRQKTVTQDELLRLIDEAAADGRETLDLAGEGLSELPPEIGRLTQLKTLILGRWDPETSSLLGNNLKTLPEAIGMLRELRSLNLMDNQLTALPEIFGQLKSLTSLYLSNNQLSALPEGIGQLKSLTALDLWNNQLSALPEGIGQLKSLTALDLSNNQLTALPKWFNVFENLNSLDLRGNPLPIPPEILGPKSLWDEPNPATETLGFYFSLQTEDGFVPLHEAKLILVGEGGAGKTSLAKKIDNEAYELTESEKSTEGIDVIRWDFPMPNDIDFRTNIWDFGGQEIYHATHQFFLTKRSLYLLVADTRQENTDFYYWLKIIELLSDNSPVLIIKNEKQDRHCEIDEGYFRSQFPNLKDSFSVNLAGNRGLDKVKDAIRYHISQLSHVGNPLPKNWVRVRAALENYSQSCNTITAGKYCDICRQNGFTDQQQMLFLSSYLHDLGVCLHFQDDMLLARTVVLKPEWATTAVYKVADSNIVRKNKGRFTNADISNIWSDRQYSDLRPELLKLMMRFKLAYELPNHPGNYIAPQLLPVSKPEYPPLTGTENLLLRYTYDFMPKGILTRFIVETHTRIEHQDHVWKNGVVLKDSWARAEIIENYPEREITVSVSGSNKKSLLEIVRSELWKIHESYEQLKYQELIPCNCNTCKTAANPEFYPHDLLMKYIGDRRYDIECRSSYENVDVRRLMSDITDHAAQVYIEEDREISRRKAYRPTKDIPPGISVGGNISNSVFIVGDKNTANLELAQTAKDLKALLDEQSEEYNAASKKGQAKIKDAVIAEIQQKPTLKTRLLKALKASGEQSLIEAVNHPAAKITIKGLKAFLEG